MNIDIIQSVRDLRPVVEELQGVAYIGYDTEADGLRPERGHRICGHALGHPDGRAWYVPVRHQQLRGFVGHEYGDWKNLDPNSVSAVLSPLLEAKHPAKIGANLKYDLRMLRREGIELGGILDAQHMARIVRPKLARVEKGKGGGYALKPLMVSILGWEIDEEKDLQDWLKSHGAPVYAYHLAPIPMVARYAGKDAVGPIAIFEKLMEEVKADDEHQRNKGHSTDRRGFRFLWGLENSLVRVLADMEDCGIPVDTAYLEGLVSDMKVAVEQKAQVVRAACGEGPSFNPGSGVQLARALYDNLKIPCPRKTEKGGRSTDKAAMEALELDYPVAKAVVEFREAQTLLGHVVGTKGNSISENVVEGICYPEIRSDAARTGRLAGSCPNLMNVPGRTDEGKRVRGIFVPEGPEWVIAGIDLSQIEPRLLAHYSNDPLLVNGYKEGKDFYCILGAALFGRKAPEDVTPKQRKASKQFFLALCYGMGNAKTAHRMSKALDRKVTEDEAKELRYRQFFQRMPGVRRLLGIIKQQVETHGFVSTMFGRWRYVDKAHIALNTVIQGSAADVFKLGILRCWRLLQGMRTHLLVPIHDENLFGLYRKERGIVYKLADAMTQFGDLVSLRVPLEADLTIYEERWGVGRELTFPEMILDTWNEIEEETQAHRKAVFGTEDEWFLAAAEVERRYPEMWNELAELRMAARDIYTRGASIDDTILMLAKLGNLERVVTDKAAELVGP